MKRQMFVLLLFFSLFGALSVTQNISAGAFAEMGEKVIMRSAEEALGETAARGISRQISTAMEESMEKMSFQEFGSLSGEAQEAFAKQLKNALEPLAKEEGITANDLSGAFKTAKENFLAEDMPKLGETKGFTATDKDVLGKMGASEEALGKFEFKTDMKVGSNIADTKANFKVEEKAPTNVEKAESNVASLEKNETQVELSKGDVKGAQKELAEAKTKLKTEQKTELENADKKVAQQESNVKTENENLDAKKQTGNQKDIVDQKEKTQETQENLDKAKQGQEEKKQQSAERNYRNAQAEREGAPDAKKQFKEAQETRNDVLKEKNKAKKAVEKAKAEGKNPEDVSGYKITDSEGNVTEVNLKEYNDYWNTKFSESETSLKVARENTGTSGKLRNRNIEEAEANAKVKTAKNELKSAEKELKANPNDETLQNKVKTAKDNLKTAQDEAQVAKTKVDDAVEADRVANANLKAAKTEWQQAGETWNAVGSRYKDFAIQTGKEQIINALLGGFLFSVSNIVVSAIQQQMAADSRYTTLALPQKFGRMWMQIPSKLLSSGGEKTQAKYLYVAMDADPKAENVKRSDDADTKSYLEKANMFMSINDYDEYATAAIPDSTFPDQMVHLNTGFKFIGDGLASDANQPTVAILSDPQKGKNLQEHLAKQQVDVERGVSGEAYYEARYQATGYEGSKTLANQFEPRKNEPYILANYPGISKKEIPRDGFGSVMNNMMTAFQGGTLFGPFKVGGFDGLDDEAMKDLGSENQGAADLPYIARGIYLYQTADTPNVKAIRAALLQSDDVAQRAVADKVFDYVIMLDENKQMVEQLQLPQESGTYNIPSYALNPEAKFMVSLIDGTQYNNKGASRKSGLAIDKLIKQVAGGYERIVGQIDAMTKFYQKTLKDMPIMIGGRKFILDPALEKKGVYVYRIAGALEDGSDDYVIALEPTKSGGTQIVQLPSSNVQYLVSLVTSRYYTGGYLPYNKPSAGIKATTYVLYKDKMGKFRPVMTAKGMKLPPQCSSTVTSGCWVYQSEAPLYSFFMDPDTNPNKPNAAEKKQLSDAGMPASELSVFPQQAQWALGTYGPVVDGQKERVAALIKAQTPDLINSIDASYKKWKAYYAKLDPKMLQREAEAFPFTTDLFRNIMLRASSIADLKNGNYIYVSDRYPGEYLVMSGDAKGTTNLGAEFSQQRYAVSLSSGKVYDAQKEGAQIDQLKNLDQLVQRAQQGKPFLPALKQKITDSQEAYKKLKRQEQFGLDTIFGPFKLYISADDLDAGTYVYGDVTKIKDPMSLSDKALSDQINNYFLAVETTGTQQKYGVKLSPKTDRIVSLVTGAWYDRGGSYLGTQDQFKLAIDGKLDVTKGFLNTMYQLTQATWGKPIRADLKAKIAKLTKQEYDAIVQEKKEIAQLRKQEAAPYADMDANTKANIDAVKTYVQNLDKMSPPLYLKLAAGKYYMVAPNPITGKKQYVDYNVSTDGKNDKDYGFGAAYDDKGKLITVMTDWALDNARAYAGVVVGADGKQTLDVAIDHPAIPMGGIILLLTVNTEKLIKDAQKAFKSASAALQKNNTDANKQALLKAAGELGAAKQAHKAAQAVDRAGLAKPTWLKFYFNPSIAAYLAQVTAKGKKPFFIDLASGYEFNSDGTPRLAESPLYIGNKNKDALFVGSTDKGLFSAELRSTFTVNNTLNSINYSTARLFETNEGIGKDVGSKKYHVRTNDTFEYFNIFYDKKDGGYNVYRVDGSDVTFTGSYLPSENEKYSFMRYYRTRTKAKPQGSFVLNDYKQTTMPTYIVWDASKPGMTLDKILFKHNLITLASAGKDSYTGSYTDANGNKKSITVTKQKKKHGKVEADYLTITEGGISYDFLFDTAILDPSLPTSCPRGWTEWADDRDKLNYWKQCLWQLNVVVDSFGITRLVDSVNTGKLRGVTLQAEPGLQNIPQAAAKAVQNNLGFIKKDLGNKPSEFRYFYKLGQAGRDKNAVYFKPGWNGWYVDLQTGILFDIGVPGNAYPIGALHPLQLAELLDGLQVGVAMVKDPQGEPQYDAEGNPITDDKGNQVKARPGLVYRSKRVVTDEMKKMAQRALNQQKGE